VNIRDILSPQGQIKLIEGPNFVEPSKDADVAARLLKYSVEKSAGAFARIYRPQRTLAFTSRDSSSAGYEQAKSRARELGFEPILRSPGGRAVAYHEESLVFDLLSSDTNPHALINNRFQAIGDLFVESFHRIGIDARVGEVPREYCPGKFSVVAENVKLVGTAQRIMRGGWLLGASVIVRNAAPVREVLGHVYQAMDVDMDPRTVAALNEFDSRITVDDLISAWHTVLKENFEVIECDLSIRYENDLRAKVPA